MDTISFVILVGFTLWALHAWNGDRNAKKEYKRKQADAAILLADYQTILQNYGYALVDSSVEDGSRQMRFEKANYNVEIRYNEYLSHQITVNFITDFYHVDETYNHLDLETLKTWEKNYANQ